jgi:ABC-type nitrate/sulfonate/bicarbonate transport system permease component
MTCSGQHLPCCSGRKPTRAELALVRVLAPVGAVLAILVGLPIALLCGVVPWMRRGL